MSLFAARATTGATATTTNIITVNHGVKAAEIIRLLKMNPVVAVRKGTFAKSTEHVRICPRTARFLY